MNTNFIRDMTTGIFAISEIDLPQRLTDRYSRIFISAIANENAPASNYQTLKILGGFALVTGLVGTVASIYLQSTNYLSQCLTNVAVGSLAFRKSLHRLQQNS